MPARDGCEPQMIRAFENDGWTIIGLDYAIEIEGLTTLFADIRMKKDDVVVVVAEVKCFDGLSSNIIELQRALGQCAMYQTALEVQNLPGTTVMAIPHLVYGTLFRNDVIQRILERNELNLVLVDIEQEEIIQ